MRRIADLYPGEAKTDATQPNPCASTTGRPCGLPVTVVLFLRPMSIPVSLSGSVYWSAAPALHPAGST